jgi:acetyl esterase/lipase
MRQSLMNRSSAVARVIAPLIVVMTMMLTLSLWLAPRSAQGQTPEGKPTAKDQGKPKVPRLPEPTEMPTGRYYNAVTYATVGNKRLQMDIALPPANKAKHQPLAMVVWIHGGGWSSGDRGRYPNSDFLLAGGIAYASIDYRLSGEAPFPAQIYDCKAAIRFLRATADQLGVDPDRIGVWGGSAGGHLVALLGVTNDVKEYEGQVGEQLDRSSRVAAVCDFFGPTILTTDPDQQPMENNKAVVKLLGGSPDKRADLARMASPAMQVTKNAVPFLIIHGSEDNVVPLRHSQLLAEKLKAVGVDVTLEILPGAAHGGPGFLNAERQQAIVEFFKKNLKPKSGGTAQPQ